MKGRGIFSNIERTTEVIAYLNKNKKIKSVAVQIDLEKCLDRTEHDSVKKVFEYFRFGIHFISG